MHFYYKISTDKILLQIKIMLHGILLFYYVVVYPKLIAILSSVALIYITQRFLDVNLSVKQIRNTLTLIMILSDSPIRL